MNSQIVTVNLIPGLCTPAVVRVSQYDVARPITFKVLDGTSTAALTANMTATIVGTKPSGLGFSETGTISGSTVTLNTTLAMTQECGMIPAEIRLTKTGENIGTANFILAVEMTPHAEGTTDGTYETMADLETRLQGEIDDLSDRIDDIEAGGSGLSSTEKQLILTLFSKAAYAEDDASTAYDTLENLWTTTTRTITYNLSHVTSSNTAASVEGGSSYTTTLTASANYTLNTVTVLMGGVNVTSQVYSSGTITIPNVTGDIVITATAIPDTERYTLYDYIYNSKAGTGSTTQYEYVDTGLTYNPSFTALDLEFEAMNSNTTTNASEGLIGTFLTATSNPATMIVYARANKAGFSMFSLGVAKQLPSLAADTAHVINYTFVDGGMSTLSSGQTSVDVATVSKSSISQSNSTLILAGSRNATDGSAYGLMTGGKSKLGYVKFTDPTNDTLLYHFIPAYDTVTQKYGFYEAVNDVFYPSNGEYLKCGNWS